MIVKNNEKAVVQEMISTYNLPIQKVLTLDSLRKKYNRFQDKRKLASSYDLFLADYAVSPFLLGLLGKPFITKKKNPILINLSGNVTKQIQDILSSLVFILSNGTLQSIRFATSSFTIEEIVSNLVDAVQGVTSHISDSTIQSLFIKMSKSPALPIYLCVNKATPKEIKEESKTVNIAKQLDISDVAMPEEIAEWEKVLSWMYPSKQITSILPDRKRKNNKIMPQDKDTNPTQKKPKKGEDVSLEAPNKMDELQELNETPKSTASLENEPTKKKSKKQRKEQATTPNHPTETPNNPPRNIPYLRKRENEVQATKPNDAGNAKKKNRAKNSKEAPTTEESPKISTVDSVSEDSEEPKLKKTVTFHADTVEVSRTGKTDRSKRRKP